MGRRLWKCFAEYIQSPFGPVPFHENPLELLAFGIDFPGFLDCGPSFGNQRPVLLSGFQNPDDNDDVVDDFPLTVRSQVHRFEKPVVRAVQISGPKPLHGIFSEIENRFFVPSRGRFDGSPQSIRLGGIDRKLGRKLCRKLVSKQRFDIGEPDNGCFLGLHERGSRYPSLSKGVLQTLRMLAAIRDVRCDFLPKRNRYALHGGLETGSDDVDQYRGIDPHSFVLHGKNVLDVPFCARGISDSRTCLREVRGNDSPPFVSQIKEFLLAIHEQLRCADIPPTDIASVQRCDVGGSEMVRIPFLDDFFIRLFRRWDIVVSESGIPQSALPRKGLR